MAGSILVLLTSWRWMAYENLGDVSEAKLCRITIGARASKHLGASP